MIHNTNKQRGNAGIALAIAYFGSNDYTVSVPLNDTQDYDLVIDTDSLESVQVKFTEYKNDAGNYVASVKSSGGTAGVIYKTFIDTEVDYLFIVCSDNTMYWFPKSIVTCKSSITLCAKYDKYKVEI